MRRSLMVFLLITILIVTFLLRMVSTLLSLLIEDASADAIHSLEIAAQDATFLEGSPPLIPKIIHQTYINESIPLHWQAAQKSCLDLHPDYEYVLWTDEKSRDFIAQEYPWFLSTFEGYEHPIQRADSIRYFVLAHYGGIYIDLDDGCKRRLDPLLNYTAWVRRTVPTGISNDIMGAVPRHPFFLRVIESLSGADKKWVLPYITIMASTGPLFLSVIWKGWMDEHSGVNRAEWAGRVRVLMPDEYTRRSWSFFTTYRGSSWHGKDAQFIFWMARNWILLTVAGFMCAALVGMGMWWAYGRLLLLGARRNTSSMGSPRMTAMKMTGKKGLPIWMRWSGEKSRGYYYEIVEQHDA